MLTSKVLLPVPPRKIPKLIGNPALNKRQPAHDHLTQVAYSLCTRTRTQGCVRNVRTRKHIHIALRMHDQHRAGLAGHLGDNHGGRLRNHATVLPGHLRNRESERRVNQLRTKPINPKLSRRSRPQQQASVWLAKHGIVVDDRHLKPGVVKDRRHRIGWQCPCDTRIERSRDKNSLENSLIVHTHRLPVG